MPKNIKKNEINDHACIGVYPFGKVYHRPLLNTRKVEEHYSKKEGVDVSYVCTTSLRDDVMPVDVFYRPVPHPQFGNRYFGLTTDPNNGQVYIMNADIVESLTLAMIADDRGEWHYSQHRHDLVSVDNKIIDGGRAYTRVSDDAEVINVQIKDGQLQPEAVLEAKPVTPIKPKSPTP